MHNTLRPSLMLAAIVTLLGCGGGDFTGSHFQELQKDCTETLRCKSGTLEFAAADAMEKCVEQAGAMLDDASEGSQQDFLDTVSRCGTLQVCDYVSCTQSDPNTGFAQLHLQEIQIQCTNIVGCQMAGGQSVGVTAVEDCINQTANALNFAPITDQQAFQNKAFKCQGLTNCAWVQCQ